MRQMQWPNYQDVKVTTSAKTLPISTTHEMLPGLFQHHWKYTFPLFWFLAYSLHESSHALFSVRDHQSDESAALSSKSLTYSIARKMALTKGKAC